MAAEQPVAQKAERFAFIHALRGIAAMLVVWSHLSGFWLLENGLTSAIQDLWYQLIARPFHVFQNGGHLGVILFFLISGYIITHTSLREDRRAFAIKRTMRIFPPLIFATFVAWLFLLVAEATDTRLLGVSGGSVWHWLSATMLLDGFLPGGRALDVTWTLIIEVIFYALTFILLGVTKGNPLRSVWLMTAAWIAIFVVSGNLGIFGANSGVAIYVGFLILGRIIYFAHQGMIRGVDAVVIGALVSIVYMVFIESADPGFLLAPGGWVGMEPLVSYAYALVIFLAMMRLAPRKVVQPFRVLGDISYSLYLLHLPVGITVLNLLHRAGVPESVNTVIAIAAAIAVSWLAYRFVEVPFQKIARRMLRPRRSITPQPEGVA